MYYTSTSIAMASNFYQMKSSACVSVKQVVKMLGNNNLEVATFLLLSFLMFL